jgi:ribosome-associated translation inhibitor RaiA
MQDSLTITFRHLDSSEAIESQVRQRFADLEKLFPRIVGCDVVIEAPQKRMASGREFKVHVKVSIPGPDINVTSDVQHGVASEDVSLAIHDAFETAGRLLIERKQKMAGR